MIANHGQSVQYYHDAVGVNSRLDSIQAAVLRIKLRELDKYSVARNNAASYYDKAFFNNQKVQTPFRNPKSTHVFHQYTLQLKNVDRVELKDFFAWAQGRKEFRLEHFNRLFRKKLNVLMLEIVTADASVIFVF